MYPSIITSFPITSPTDRLNNPSHSGLENTQSSAIGQVQTFIGRVSGVGASALGTILYDVRSPDSGGGGHVQTAVLGGTGQTTFTKGDILVSTSPSVLSKLAAPSVAGQALVSAPETATGVRWADVIANKVVINTSSVVVSSTLNADIVLFSASILGSTLGTNNGIRFTGVVQNYANDSTQQFTLVANYGNNVIASIISANSAAVGSVMSGTISGMIVGNGGISSQLGYVLMELQTSHNGQEGIQSGQFLHLMKQGASSIESSANQNLIITGKWNGGTNNRASILTGLFVVEKIV